MGAGLQSVLTGTAGLAVAAIAALYLALARAPVSVDAWPAVAKPALFAIAAHVVHFLEEWYSGFAEAFPEMLGLAPWPGAFFPVFNLACIGLWLVSIALLCRFPRPAVMPLWFLAIAATVNGIAHPLLAAAAGGYFPGLITSPLIAAAGIALLRSLRRATAAATPV